jgi:hypothetical protein
MNQLYPTRRAFFAKTLLDGSLVASGAEPQFVLPQILSSSYLLKLISFQSMSSSFNGLGNGAITFSGHSFAVVTTSESISHTLVKYSAFNNPAPNPDLLSLLV